MKANALCLALALMGSSVATRADALDALRNFAKEVRSGRAEFTQTVISPDGARKKNSSGSFEFVRPNRFRFAYTQPFEQLILGDGQKVWIFDADLNQATSKKMSQALGSTPAALLAGGVPDKDFELRRLPHQNHLDWVLATPKIKDSGFQSLQIGFRGKELAAVEMLDNFGQRSVLQFSGFVSNTVIANERFEFKPPAGVDVIEQ
jgi:outer membrane lipoprotein carrier protein